MLRRPVTGEVVLAGPLEGQQVLAYIQGDAPIQR
jgi:hypothetical protein